LKWVSKKLVVINNIVQNVKKSIGRVFFEKGSELVFPLCSSALTGAKDG